MSAEEELLEIEEEEEEKPRIEWEIVTRAFPILRKDRSLLLECSNEEYLRIEKVIVEVNYQSKIRDHVFLRLEDHIRRVVVPPFWSLFTKIENEMVGFQTFKSAVFELHQAVSECTPLLNRLTLLSKTTKDKKTYYGEKEVIKGFKIVLKGALLAELPRYYHVITGLFLKIAFNVFDNENRNSDNFICAGCKSECSDCNCGYIIKVFYEVNKKLLDLQIHDRILGQILTNFIQNRIEQHIQKICNGSFDVSVLDQLKLWLNSSVLVWVTKSFCGGMSEPLHDDNNTKTVILVFKQKITTFAYKVYANYRIDQLFKIIIEYPDSQAAVNDLKICMSRTNLRSVLCKKLQNALETKLLHPGVNTPEILTAYVSTIRALRQLDPSGTILEIVTKPVRNYLRNREDTIRSVVSSFTDEGSTNELAEELANYATEDEDLDKEEAWNDWKPEPIDADPKTFSEKKDSDIISMLVNIYGSKELFVSEYRTLLADRLLAQTVINTEREIKYLELLKLRFGESQLYFCEVMLKDITDSAKINGMIQNDKHYEAFDKKFDCSAMILSAQFWPPFKDESLELPDVVKQHLEAYTKSFEELKGNRSLSWKQHLGNVDIEIEIGGKIINLTVSPFNATLIIYFENKPEWTLDELQRVMRVPVTILRRKIAYWQSMGIISERLPDCFILNEGNEASKSNISSNPVQEMICEDDESESAMASAHDQREGELQVFWSYIVGMLTNLDSLPLDRIHQMLKMFASQAPGTECSLQDLRQFLDTKVRGHQLVLQGGLYKLPKN